MLRRNFFTGARFPLFRIHRSSAPEAKQRGLGRAPFFGHSGIRSHLYRVIRKPYEGPFQVVAEFGFWREILVAA